MDYPVLNKYLKANPSNTIDQLFAMEDAIRYAKWLKGTTLDDIYNAETERALYVIASALEIVAYTSKSKKQLRELCIEKYNRVFKSTDEIKIKKKIKNAFLMHFVILYGIPTSTNISVNMFVCVVKWQWYHN